MSENYPGWHNRGTSAALHSGWTHESGWTIAHCGHPTANWPYWLQHPARPGIVVSFNGLGFKTQEAARLVVHGIVAGEVTLSNDNCAAGLSIANRDAFGRAL